MEELSVKELAELLDGNEYLEEIDNELAARARESHLVVVFGQSDDLMQIRGAVDDEVDVYNGGTAYFMNRKLLANTCEWDSCPYFKEMKKKARKVKAIWSDTIRPCWKYETDIPHCTFAILEDGEFNCEGIVFDIRHCDQEE